MGTKHDQSDEHSCVKSKCRPAESRPKDWSPTIGPIHRSKGVKRQEKRVMLQQWHSKRNAEYYQNGREWMSP